MKQSIVQLHPHNPTHTFKAKAKASSNTFLKWWNCQMSDTDEDMKWWMGIGIKLFPVQNMHSFTLYIMIAPYWYSTSLPCELEFQKNICFQERKSGDYDDEALQLSVSSSFRDSPWQNFFATADFRRHPFEGHKPHYHPNVINLESSKMQNTRVYKNLVF